MNDLKTESISKLPQNNKEISTIQEIYKNNNQITTIQGIFQNNNQITTFQGIFQNNNQITTILGIFQNKNKITTIQGIFQNKKTKEQQFKGLSIDGLSRVIYSNIHEHYTVVTLVNPIWATKVGGPRPLFILYKHHSLSMVNIKRHLSYDFFSERFENQILKVVLHRKIPGF